MKAWLLAVAGLCTSAPLLAAESSLRIDIEYQWQGWGGVMEHWRIERDALGVTTRVNTDAPLTAGGRERTLVPAAAVSAFAAAIDAPPITMDAAVSEIIRQLDRAAIATLDQRWSRTPRVGCSLALQQDWVRQTLTAVELRRRVTNHLSAGMWTDDYPAMSITVTRAGKPRIAFGSTSQKALMLPWRRVPVGKQPPMEMTVLPEEWRPALSNAVAALLPPGEKTRSRFTAVWLQNRLRGQLEHEALACRWSGG